MYMYKTWKVIYKIRPKIFFLKLATNGQSDEAFLLTSGFCPQRVVCPCPGAIYIMVKHEKMYMYIKLGFKAIFLKLQQMGKVIRAFGWHQMFVCPCPGLYTYIKSFKMCIKVDFLFLNLQRMGKVIRAFC